MNDKLEKARKGDLETQREVIDAIFNADSFEQMMSQLQPDDEQWLRQLANEKHDARAITLLLAGMENRYRTWDEEYEDEDDSSDNGQESFDNNTYEDFLDDKF